MAANPRLDVQWFRKNRQPCLAKGAVEKALQDYQKTNRSLERSGDAAGFFKVIGGLKAAISKDKQTARKAKDKDAVNLLGDLEKLVHATTKAKEGHLTPDRKFLVDGLSKASASQVNAGQGDFNDTIVNQRDRAWQLMKSNKSVSSAKSKSCEAVPKSTGAKHLSGWKKEKVNWSCILRSQSNVPVVSVRFQLEYQWNGRDSSINGVFLNDYRLFVVDSRIQWGYSVDIEVSTGKPTNSGSRKSAVGAIPLEVRVYAATPLESTTKTWTITCHGNRQRDVK